MASNDSDINMGLLVTIGIVSTLVVIVVVLGMSAALQWAYENELQYKQNMEGARPGPHLDRAESLLAVNSRQMNDIAKMEWVDQEKGIVRVPIDRAIEVYAERQKQQGGQ
ncbi:MAG: hypothetical protein MI741_17210 [Rhodospirillales bacterium]|nr:hypothetical protein [Rhodospirillales bacterium]